MQAAPKAQAQLLEGSLLALVNAQQRLEESWNSLNAGGLDDPRIGVGSLCAGKRHASALQEGCCRAQLLIHVRIGLVGEVAWAVRG